MQENLAKFASETHQRAMDNTTPSNTGKRPYRLGLALSGGGARGFAHAGALLAIEEAGLRPDVIAGVSAGAIASVLYAGGLAPLEIAKLFGHRTFRDFASLSIGHGGLLNFDRLRNFIHLAIGGIRNLEDLKIPTYLGVTDFDAGESTYFSTGEIGPRVAASCSIPMVFSPVEIDGVHYVDGGVLRNHPAWIIRDKCDFLIGVNVSPLRHASKYKNLMDVAMRTYNLMAKSNQSRDMALCDLSIETPEIAAYAIFDLSNIKNVFISGYVHTRKALREAGLWNPSGTPPKISDLSHN